MSAILTQANFSDVQFDGFEKLQLISRVDFGHSDLTFDSGLYRGHITPGHYHLPWPLRVGQGILQAIEETHARLDSSLAVELSFMASGLGPYRPAMNTYVDEKIIRNNASSGPDGYVLLGLQWHAKLVQRTELTGMAINACEPRVLLSFSCVSIAAGYPENPVCCLSPPAFSSRLSPCPKFAADNMVIDPQDPNDPKNDRLIASQFELDYFLGGLITTGIGPQPFSKGHVIRKYDGVVRGWLERFYRYGHLREEAIQTLHYDSSCCHIQGVCQWTPCPDVVTIPCDVAWAVQVA